MTTFQNVWPVNELGEIVAAAGVGSSNITGFMNQDQIPVGSDNKVKIAGMAQLVTAGSVVNTIADLKALAAGQFSSVHVLGYYAAGDGGGDVFR